MNNDLPTPPAPNNVIPPVSPTTVNTEERVEMLVAGKSPNRANIMYEVPAAPKNYRPLKSKTGKKTYDPNNVIATFLPPPPPASPNQKGKNAKKNAKKAAKRLSEEKRLSEPVVKEFVVEEVVEAEEKFVEYVEKKGEEYIYLLSFESLPIAEPLNLSEFKTGTKLCGTTFVDYGIYMDQDFVVVSGHVAVGNISLDNIVLSKYSIKKRILKLRPALPEVGTVVTEERIANHDEGVYSDNSCHLQHALNGLKKDPKYAAIVNTIQEDMQNKEQIAKNEMESLKLRLSTVTDEEIAAYLVSRLVIRGTKATKLYMLMINLTSDLNEAKGEGKIMAYRVQSKLLKFPAAYYEKRVATAEGADLKKIENALSEADGHIDEARVNIAKVHDILEGVYNLSCESA